MRNGSAGGARPASQQSMRQHNLALVMGTVAGHGPVSRAAVAGHTGLTRPAVSSLVDALLAAGLLTELGPAANGRVGRPGSALMVSDRGPAGLGLEVGVGHLGVCVTDLRGQVRAWTVVDSPNAALPPAEVLARLAALADEATETAAGLGLRPVAAVMAVPGLVAESSGTVESAPNLGWHHVPVADLWAGPLPPRVENEANLGALAELWAHPVAADFIHVSAESGIGAALVVGGRLFTGARGLAGELGHMPVHPDGPSCSCGARGCLEQYAAKAAVLRAAGLPPSRPGDTGSPRVREGDGIGLLAARAREGDVRVVRALEKAGEALGTALAGAVNLLDPAAVVLGGAYAELGEWLVPPTRRELAARVTVRAWDPAALTVSELGRRGPLLGAALATVRSVLEDPAALGA
ncbi:ROK family protein [Nonomuraea sp. NPDC048826]|uniref:ROK family protein n=1 Tax=Nonomuraea sp. NPDC048826 TaxID=3364347 RepID=UPI00371C89AF